MTTPVETAVTTAPKKVTKTRKAPAAKRDFNALGKFFAKVRIDLSMTTAQWAKALGVSQLAITNVERGDHKISFDLALGIAKLIQEKAPHYEGEFAYIVAEELGVLVIPANASREQVSVAYDILVNGIVTEEVTGSAE